MMRKEKRKINTSMVTLMEIFGISSDELTYYLNSETGKIAIHSNLSGAFDENGNEIKEKNPFAGKKYIEIPGILSYEAFKDMERFSETIVNEEIQQKLHTALHKKNPIRLFYRLLDENPQVDKEWTDYRDNCIRLRVLSWLNDNNLELVGF